MLFSKSTLIGFVVFLMLCLYSLVLGGMPEYRPVLVDAYSAPHLQLPKNPVSLGVVVMDTVSKHRIALQNTGGTTLILKEIRPSCGCTAVLADESRIPPGKTTFLTVRMDTSLKLGSIRKTVDIESNDPQFPVQMLIINAQSIAPKGSKQHGTLIKVKDPLVLFKGDCASCHIQRGQNKTGESLFIADCGMCHGLQAEGGVAPRLNNVDMQNPLTRHYIEDVIRNGSPHNPSMPPFSQAKGGPLTEAQVASLLTYLMYLSKLKP
jgi:mono/diheme cytochrome c family protein